MLGGQPVRRRVAARLAARQRPLLVDGDLEAALGQLVRGAQAADAAAENRHGGRHGATLRTPSVFGHHTLTREQRLQGTPDDVFPFFADAGNLEAITPPWLGFHVVTPRPIEMRDGTLIEYRLTLHRLPIRWLTRIESGCRASASWTRSSTVRTRSGTTPTSSSPTASDHTLMRDTVRYALPFGPLGEIAHRLFVARDLERIFDYRTRELALHARGAVIADRAVERVLAGLEVDRERRRVLAGDRLGRPPRRRCPRSRPRAGAATVGELDRHLARLRRSARSR